MAEALALVGGVAAGLQMVLTAARALHATVQLVKDMKDVPERLALRLHDVNTSISRLCEIYDSNSQVLEGLEPLKRQRLFQSADNLHTALQTTHNLLTQRLRNDQDRRRLIRCLWLAIISPNLEKKLSEKLERLNSLNIEMIRELGMLGLEIQVGISALVTAGNAATSQGISSMEAKIDTLRDNVQDLVESVDGARISPFTNPHSCETYPHQAPSSLSNGSKRTRTASNSESASTSGTDILPEEGRLSKRRTVQMRRYLALTPGALNAPAADQLPNANLDFVLYSIRAFYSMGSPDISDAVPFTPFWENTNKAVYYINVSGEGHRGASRNKSRGLCLLRKLTADGSNTLDTGRVTILIELLSTLSPIFTADCSYVRDGMLLHLHRLARVHLPREHPIALVINTLKQDKHDKNLSLRALAFIAEWLRVLLGPLHRLTHLAIERLCRVLRRNGDHTEALGVAHDSVRAIRAASGCGSLQERWILRQIAHVYMDEGNLPEALSVCFDIVGQQRLDASGPEPLYHDKCALWTMEDIAKICEGAGNLQQAVAWLKQARITAEMLGQWTESKAHIEEKIEEMMKQMGDQDGLQAWKAMFSSEDIVEEELDGYKNPFED